MEEWSEVSGYLECYPLSDKMSQSYKPLSTTCVALQSPHHGRKPSQVNVLDLRIESNYPSYFDPAANLFYAHMVGMIKASLPLGGKATPRRMNECLALRHNPKHPVALD